VARFFDGKNREYVDLSLGYFREGNSMRNNMRFGDRCKAVIDFWHASFDNNGRLRFGLLRWHRRRLISFVANSVQTVCFFYAPVIPCFGSVERFGKKGLSWHGQWHNWMWSCLSHAVKSLCSASTTWAVSDFSAHFFLSTLQTYIALPLYRVRTAVKL